MFALSPSLEARAQAYRAWSASQPGARLGLFEEDRFEFAAALLGLWAAGKHVVLPADPLPATLRALPVDAMVVRAPTLDTKEPLTWSPAAVLTLFTSGSTGQPVGIEKRARQLVAEVDTLEATFGSEVGASQFVSTVSHQHIYGLLFSVLWPLRRGRGLTAQRVEYPEALEVAFAANASVLISSPAQLKRLPERTWAATPHVVFSSGGPLSDEGVERARAAFSRSVTEVFGSTETGGIAWRRRPEQPTWRALRGVEWRSSEDVLEVRSPHLLSDAWFRTTDRIGVDGEGFTLLGRADRIVKVEEKRVSLEAIELAAVATSLVSRAVALLGEDGRIWLVSVPTEQGTALLASGRRSLSEALRERLATSIERVALPRRFRFVDAVPMNAQGKTTRAELLRLFAPERPEPEWLERGASEAKLRVVITPELRVLDGHFPETPVVAGVAQVDWAITFARECFAMPPNLTQLLALKFQALLRPGMSPTIDLKWDVERQTLTFKYADETRVFSSGRAVFAAR